MSEKVFVRGGHDRTEVRIDIAVLGDEAFRMYATPPAIGQPLRLDVLIIMIACHVWAQFNEEFPLSSPSAPVDTPEFNAELLDQMALAFAKMPALDEAEELGQAFQDMAGACRSAASGQDDAADVVAFLAGLRLGSTQVGSRHFKEQRLAREVLARSRKAQTQRLEPVRQRREELVSKIRSFAIEAKARDPSISDAEIGRRFRIAEDLPRITTSNNEAKIIRQLRRDGRLQEES